MQRIESRKREAAKRQCPTQQGECKERKQVGFCSLAKQAKTEHYPENGTINNMQHDDGTEEQSKSEEAGGDYAAATDEIGEKMVSLASSSFIPAF